MTQHDGTSAQLPTFSADAIIEALKYEPSLTPWQRARLALHLVDVFGGPPPEEADAP